MQKLRALKIAVWTIPPAWLLVLVAAGLALWALPDVVTHEVAAGTFVSSDPYPNGSMNPALSRIRTSTSTLVVQGILSAPLGEPLIVQDSSQNGLQVCVPRSPRTCTPLAGTYIGTLQPVSHPRVWLSYAQRAWLGLLSFLWLLLVPAIWVIVGVMAEDTAEYK